MKTSNLNRLGRISLILAAAFLFTLPMIFGSVFAQAPAFSQQKSEIIQGRIVGNQLMLIDTTGRQTLATDGVYTLRDGSKISVQQGHIIDIDSRKTNRSGMVGIIEIPE